MAKKRKPKRKAKRRNPKKWVSKLPLSYEEVNRPKRKHDNILTRQSRISKALDISPAILFSPYGWEDHPVKARIESLDFIRSLSLKNYTFEEAWEELDKNWPEVWDSGDEKTLKNLWKTWKNIPDPRRGRIGAPIPKKSQRRKTTPFKKGRCSECSKTGHKASHCPKSRCQLCQKKGHRESVCQLKKLKRKSWKTSKKTGS